MSFGLAVKQVDSEAALPASPLPVARASPELCVLLFGTCVNTVDSADSCFAATASVKTHNQSKCPGFSVNQRAITRAGVVCSLSKPQRRWDDMNRNFVGLGGPVGFKAACPSSVFRHVINVISEAVHLLACRIVPTPKWLIRRLMLTHTRANLCTDTVGRQGGLVAEPPQGLTDDCIEACNSSPVSISGLQLDTIGNGTQLLRKSLLLAGGLLRATLALL